VLDEPLPPNYGWELLMVLKGTRIPPVFRVLFYSLDGANGSGSMLALDYLMNVGSGELLQALGAPGLGSGEATEAKTS